jgi:hypothetical protein
VDWGAAFADAFAAAGDSSVGKGQGQVASIKAVDSKASKGTCAVSCGLLATAGDCYCDAFCSDNGDCCADMARQCPSQARDKGSCVERYAHKYTLIYSKTQRESTVSTTERNRAIQTHEIAQKFHTTVGADHHSRARQERVSVMLRVSSRATAARITYNALSSTQCTVFI